MPCPLLIFSQSDYSIQVVDTNLHSNWQTVQIQISWLLKKANYTVCKGRIYPGSAGPGLRVNMVQYFVSLRSFFTRILWNYKFMRQKSYKYLRIKCQEIRKSVLLFIHDACAICLPYADDTKWPTRVDVSLNPNTINKIFHMRCKESYSHCVMYLMFRFKTRWPWWPWSTHLS